MIFPVDMLAQCRGWDLKGSNQYEMAVMISGDETYWVARR